MFSRPDFVAHMQGLELHIRWCECISPQHGKFRTWVFFSHTIVRVNVVSIAPRSLCKAWTLADVSVPMTHDIRLRVCFVVPENVHNILSTVHFNVKKMCACFFPYPSSRSIQYFLDVRIFAVRMLESWRKWSSLDLSSMSQQQEISCLPVFLPSLDLLLLLAPHTRLAH